MKHRYLAASIAACLFLGAAVSPANAGPTPAPIALASLSAALEDGARPDSQNAWITSAFGHRLMWFDESELRHDTAQTQAMEALEAGMAVMITRSGAPDTTVANLFGFQDSAKRAIYQRRHNGELDVGTVADDMRAQDAALVFTDWLAERGAPAVSRMARSAPARMTSAPFIYVPTTAVHQDQVFQNGRRIKHDITVVRDIRPGSDRKIITVKSQVVQRPEDHGTFWGGDGSFNTRDKTYHLFIPLRYDVQTTIAPVSGKVRFDLGDYRPVAGKPKDMLVNETLSTQIAGGSNLPRDLIDFISGFADGPAGVLGKLPLVFPGDDGRTESKSVSMTIQDYTILNNIPSEKNGVRGISWSFALDESIASDESRFREEYSSTGYPLYALKNTTPMMHMATMESVSTWMLDGAYEGLVDVTTRSTIVNKVFFHKKMTLPGIESTMNDDGASDIAYTTRINLGSPRLTRQPTVRLQSRSGLGLCLSQPTSTMSDVAMEACGKGDGGRSQQWYLESDHTYRNRGSGMCLTAHPASGELHMAECGSGLNQQWKWSADRIASSYQGGNLWRLHLRDGKPSAMYDAERHDAIVTNVNQALLPPWSSYPAKPSANDTIPTQRDVAPIVPESYRALRAVGDEERWQAMPVISGL